MKIYSDIYNIFLPCKYSLENEKIKLEKEIKVLQINKKIKDSNLKQKIKNELIKYCNNNINNEKELKELEILIDNYLDDSKKKRKKKNLSYLITNILYILILEIKILN